MIKKFAKCKKQWYACFLFYAGSKEGALQAYDQTATKLMQFSDMDKPSHESGESEVKHVLFVRPLISLSYNKDTSAIESMKHD